jgi:hypothetical protein
MENLHTHSVLATIIHSEKRLAPLFSTLVSSSVIYSFISFLTYSFIYLFTGIM